MKNINTEMLGALQEKVMKVLWEAERPLKPAEVLDKMGDKHAYTTVMTILKRLAEKKILKRKLEGKAFVYEPISDQKEFVGSNLKDIYGELVGSYGSAAIANFVDVIKNNKDDMALLKEYLAAQK
jgi:predicted transcriptional regulator